MNLPIQVESFKAFAGLRKDLHLAIGVFDGVHLGHQAVVGAAVSSAGPAGVNGVLTFDPHPSRLFRPENPTRLIMPIEEKVRRLRKIGVDCVICKQFDREFAAIPAEDFLPFLKEQMPTLKAIYVGENFRFGQKRAGDVSTLLKSGLALGMKVSSSKRIKHNGDPISSTRIRAELEAGRLVGVNDLLGCNYTSSGTIVEGAKLGRKIGFPTLNIPWEPECRPKFGVYFVRFRENEEDRFKFAVANYGVKPTVQTEGQGPCLEIHGLEPTKLGPGGHLEVEWLRFIRPEHNFESVDALTLQIAKDRDLAVEWAANA